MIYYQFSDFGTPRSHRQKAGIAAGLQRGAVLFSKWQCNKEQS